MFFLYALCCITNIIWSESVATHEHDDPSRKNKRETKHAFYHIHAGARSNGQMQVKSQLSRLLPRPARLVSTPRTAPIHRAPHRTAHLAPRQCSPAPSPPTLRISAAPRPRQLAVAASASTSFHFSPPRRNGGHPPSRRPAPIKQPQPAAQNKSPSPNPRRKTLARSGGAKP
jgi:hypothetical protein